MYTTTVEYFFFFFFFFFFSTSSPPNCFTQQLPPLLLSATKLSFLPFPSFLCSWFFSSLVLLVEPHSGYMKGSPGSPHPLLACFSSSWLHSQCWIYKSNCSFLVHDYSLWILAGSASLHCSGWVSFLAHTLTMSVASNWEWLCNLAIFDPGLNYPPPHLFYYYYNYY